MNLKNTQAEFGLAAKIFHWFTAILIFLLLSVGFYMAGLPVSPQKIQIYFFHKSFGLLVLLLAALRLLWRVYNPPPPGLASHAKWEKTLAHLIHVLIYAALFLMPLSGWVMSSAGDFPVSFFGLFEMPVLTPKNKDVFELMQGVHTAIAFTLLAALALHMAGAFKHHFIDKDVTLKRMTSMKLGFTGGVILALAAGILWIKPVLLAIGDDEDEARPAAITEQAGSENQAAHENLSSDAPEWAIEKDQSAIQFIATQYGTAFQGSFPDFDGEIYFDPDNIGQSLVNIEINLRDIKTGSDDRDAQAQSPDWFDTEQYRKAVFRAGKFEQNAQGQYIAHGDLTLRGATMPLDLPFTLEFSEEDGKHFALMRAEITLNRLDYGVGQGQWASAETIGTDVRLSITVKARHVD